LDTRALIKVAIETSFPADKGRLADALAQLALDDVALSFEFDDNTRQFVLKGFSADALDLALDRLKNHDKLSLRVGAPQVAYCETLTKDVAVDFTHKRVAHGKGEFARVKLRLRPIGVNEPCIIEAADPEPQLSAEFIQGVETGVASVFQSGSYAGLPMLGVRVNLVDGAWHPEDSSGKTFEIEARAAMREAAHDGDPALLEPVMRVKICFPAAHGSEIESDIRMRRGLILGRQPIDADAGIEAAVPLVMLLKYEDTLRTIARGQCSFEMDFSHYALLPIDPPRPPPAAMYAG
jgi:elongation factor G